MLYCSDTLRFRITIVSTRVPQDEKFDSSGPSISELVGKENVDKLEYMGWLVDQGADPQKVLWTITHPWLL